MDPTRPASPLFQTVRTIEDAELLDGPVQAMEPIARALFATGTRGSVLRGDWLGHALHPLLTDLVVGTWTSATLLDVVGGKSSARSAQILVGTGLLAVGPTAWSGWADWTTVEPEAKRVGLVHAVANGMAATLYAQSFRARRKGRRGAGIRYALAGGMAMKVGAYLGGHLAAPTRP